MEIKAGKIFSLIPKVMADINPIGKDQRNEQQNYKFRGIDDMYNSIQPALIKHGVFCCPQVQKVEATELERPDGKVAFRVIITVAHRFYADDGSYVEALTIGEGIDRSDKASNKAMSAAMKYAFIELFSLRTEDTADSDRTSPKAGKTRHAIKTVTKVAEFI
jgi:hypothetical protein